MNVEVLRYFVELANAGSFYSAAKGLFMSQQGLNKAITTLEDELRVKLLERTRRGIKLTPEGERFLVFAQRVSEEYIDYLGSLYADGSKSERLPEDPMSMRVTYYASQIAASSQEHVSLLSDAVYSEEPFEKIIHRIRATDGSDLNFVDLHANTAARILSDPTLAFEPIISTRIGVVCREDSPLLKLGSLHRSDVAGLPSAVNAHREMAQVLDWLFRDNALSDVRMSATSPRMLLRYVKASEQAVAIYDSFGFYLAGLDESRPTKGLRFVGLSTPEALCFIGFLFLKHVRPKPRVLLTAKVLSRYVESAYSDYFEQYPMRAV